MGVPSGLVRGEEKGEYSETLSVETQIGQRQRVSALVLQNRKPTEGKDLLNILGCPPGRKLT